jgi:hypothetical protein
MMAAILERIAMLLIGSWLRSRRRTRALRRRAAAAPAEWAKKEQQEVNVFAELARQNAAHAGQGEPQANGEAGL